MFCFHCCVIFDFVFVVVKYVKVPPLLGERVGGECYEKRVNCICFGSAVEASADVFYVFLPYGDDARCLMRKSYMGEKLDSFVGGGFGVVKRRQV